MLFGVILAFMYFPASPVYILGNLTEVEIGFWALAQFVFSFIFFLTSYRFSQLIWVVVLSIIFLIILQVAALVLYWQYFPEGTVGPLFHQVALRWTYFLPHSIFLALLLLSLFLLLKKQPSS